jgi:NADH:ubiquinone oxidoreductase subunit C
MSLTVFFSDTCPRCHKLIMQADIEPHPTRSDFALQNFKCVNCGPVKTKILSLRSNTPPTELAA